VQIPGLPLQNPTFQRIADAFGLDSVERFESLTRLERRVVKSPLFRKVVVAEIGRRYPFPGRLLGVSVG
jgi:hypothetical protein